MADPTGANSGGRVRWDALIWIEGKRFDWLDPSTTWDVTRDQLARNIEAVASLAGAASKDYRLLICHEDSLTVSITRCCS